jgi:hypothetical protein
MSSGDLEGPTSNASLYLARGSEVQEARSIFTGDVFDDITVQDGTGERKIKALVLQHPCALRTNGVALASRLLVAEVRDYQLIPERHWNGNYKIMPLPEMNEGNFAALFQEPHLVPSESLEIKKRIMCMSQHGVNLLLQRWVHHNSRAVISTSLYQEVTAVQFEEADLIEEWCLERADTEEDILQESTAAHEWLRSPSLDGENSWQKLLDDIQTRSTVRKAMRKHLKSLS